MDTDLLTPEKSTLEKSRYVNEAHNGEFLKNKMIKIRTKYSFKKLNYHLIIYWRVIEKLNSPYRILRFQ